MKTKQQWHTFEKQTAECKFTLIIKETNCRNNPLDILKYIFFFSMLIKLTVRKVIGNRRNVVFTRIKLLKGKFAMISCPQYSSQSKYQSFFLFL
jgi:hypothetical protein